MNTAVTKKISAAVAALALAAVAGPSLAQPNQVAPVDVTQAAPTRVIVTTLGKDAVTVRHDVRAAAWLVCRNAARNDANGVGDVGACALDAAFRGMQQYRVILARTQTADAGVIVLAAR